MSRIATLLVVLFVAALAGRAAAGPSHRVLLVGTEARGPAKRLARAAEARLVSSLDATAPGKEQAKALRRCLKRSAASCLQAAARNAGAALVLTSAVRRAGKKFLLELRLYSALGVELTSARVAGKKATLAATAAEAAKRLVFVAQLRRPAVADPVPVKERVAQAQAADAEDPR